MSHSEKADPADRLSAPCPCGSGRSFADCCEPLLEGRRRAATAEELMRARFTAHATHHQKFLHESYRETVGRPFVPETGDPLMQWTRLEVHAHELTSDPDRSFVDFSAYGLDQSKNERVHHEKAEFRRVDGAWLYTKELRVGPAPVRAAGPKVGRNDPCPCGSGRKYKHCCLAKT